MLRILARLLVVVLFLLPLIVLGGVFLSIDDVPLVSARAELSATQVARAKQLLAEHDPRKLADGEIKTIGITEDEIGLIMNHVLGRFGAGGADVRIVAGRLDAVVTISLPENPAGAYLNLEVGLIEGDGVPRFRRLRLGRLSVPAAIADAAMTMGIGALYARSELAEPEDIIRSVHFGEGALDVTYQWQSGIAEAVRTQLLSDADRERLGVYHQALAGLTGKGSGSVGLGELVEGLFSAAHARSGEGDAVDENRAAILVLAAYVNGRNAGALAGGQSEAWPELTRRTVKIHGRKDLSQHFMTSAALAVTGGDALSRAIGLYKEIDDSRGGSGFSFRDLAADNAGTHFGRVATESRARAERLQVALSDGLSEAALLPELDGLEERMSQAEFEQRYGGVGSPKYEATVREIEARIVGSTLYR